MHKTTSSMHYSSSTLFLLLLVLTAKADSNKKQDEEQEDGPDKNVSMIHVEIHNDLPSNTERLYVYIDQSTRVASIIEKGKSYKFVAAGRKKEMATLTKGVSCAFIVVFDPKVDSGHHAVFWSARRDGVYRSWDRRNWRKARFWYPPSIECLELDYIKQ